MRDIIAEFGVTVIVVLGHERLYNDMARRYAGKAGISVLKLTRSGGAAERSDSYIQHLQNYVTKQYFYGELSNILSPVSRTLDFKFIKVFRIAEGIGPRLSYINPLTGTTATHASALPIGQSDPEVLSDLEVVQLESPAVLQHSTLAITTVGIDEDPRGILEANILGFIFVYSPPPLTVLISLRSDVDDVKGKLTVLQPMKGNITNILVMGTFKWQDT